jgi:hypothetical protein
MIALINHRTIIAYTFDGFGMFLFEMLREVLNEAKLTQGTYFRAIRIVKHGTKIVLLLPGKH